ncbi:MAG: RusA family crossover junction endodeoxyribonuclease [Chlorobiaceae bacterium]|nr:RusA family crossover junction endodeoxyribonuclease [Chlorobiaceae bacterium]
MSTIEFFVPGPPQALKRHRAFLRGNRPIMVDPSSTDKGNFLLSSLAHRPEQPIRDPLVVVLDFGFPRPKSHFGSGVNASKMKQYAPHYHTSKPDIDNLQKFVMDALNGVFWHDDSCVCVVHAAKRYSDTPGVRVTISPAEA